MQDEPVNSAGSGNTSPDGSGVGTSPAQVRSERSGNADGRVYHIFFTASDGKGASDSGTCSGQVTVSVPHDQAHAAVDEGPLYDSTVLPSSNNGNNKPSITTTTAPATKSATTMIPTPTPSQTGKTMMANSSSFSSTTNTVRGPSPQHQQQSPSQSPIQLQPQPKSPYPYPYQNQYPYQAQHQPIQQLQQGQQRPNQPPIANAGVSQTVYGGTIVTLDGRASHDPDNYALGTSSYGTSIIIKNGIADLSMDTSSDSYYQHHYNTITSCNATRI